MEIEDRGPYRRPAVRAPDRMRDGQGARQADRDQPQRQGGAGSAGPPPARRRAVDQGESRRVPEKPGKLIVRRLVFLAALALAAPGQAQSPGAIIAAEQAGLIGERYDGYLGYVIAPPPGLRRQVDAVNIRRRTLYYNLAVTKGV